MTTPRALASEFDSADESPGLLLWQQTHRWQAAQRATLKPLDLTHVQFVLLASLTWLSSDRPVTQREIAELAATDPMMTSQVLRVLEAKGLVVRAAHPTDARAKALTVTPEGKVLANKANALVEECDRRFFASLGNQRHEFVKLLQKLR